MIPAPVLYMKWFLLLLLVISSSAAMAQSVGTYRIQIEDVLLIQVYREDALSAEIRVGRDGNITAPFVGTVRAVGKTAAELASELERLYVQVLRLNNPKVSVTIRQFRAIRATISGAVRRPDAYDFRPGDTILTLLARGGGIAADSGADTRRATLRRANSNELIPIDLYTMLTFADTSQNFVVEDGDELNVPERKKPFVSVLGALPSPGTYPYREGMTALDALSLARGGIPNKSLLSKTTVVREMPGRPGEVMRIEVDLVRFVKGNDSSQNILLQPGDIVWVPETKTPDWERLGSIASSLFWIDRIFTGDFFGLRVFGK